jgi:rhodanese-related sulfurtransferase
MNRLRLTAPRVARRRSWPCALFVFAVFAASCSGEGAGGSAANATWGDTQLVQAADLAATLADSATAKPMLVHVGARVLYRAGAIPGSLYAGPGSDPAGIEALLAAVQGQPKDRDIVIYCGCCPANHCPNIKPAYAAMRKAGFTHVKALWIGKDFDADWANHGYPTAKPSL